MNSKYQYHLNNIIRKGLLFFKINYSILPFFQSIIAIIAFLIQITKLDLMLPILN